MAPGHIFLVVWGKTWDQTDLEVTRLSAAFGQTDSVFYLKANCSLIVGSSNLKEVGVRQGGG